MGRRSGFAWSPAPAWSLSLAGFYQRSSDLIVFEIEGAFRYKPQNVGEAEVGGLELELRIPLSPDITALAHYTLLLSFDRSGRPNFDGNWLPGWPQHSGGVRVWGSWRSLLFEGEATYVGSNFVNGANTKEIPQRLLLDAGIGIKAGAGLRLMVQGRNLTNAQTEDVRGFPLPGISFFLTASWQQGEKT